MPDNYTTIQGDTWDIISKRVTGSEMYAADFITLNYHHQNTVIFGAGVVLQVPVITRQQQNEINLPPWRRAR